MSKYIFLIPFYIRSIYLFSKYKNYYNHKEINYNHKEINYNHKEINYNYKEINYNYKNNFQQSNKIFFKFSKKLNRF